MAQAEDTELRDLVIEALEKNGSLAKIRALLRANIFLAFEDEYQNVKQNVILDNILRMPEGVLALSIVHEFLEFCNLKNTLFVYMSESRQGKEYTYEGQKILKEKLHFCKRDAKEPILVTLLKKILKSYGRKCREKDDNLNKGMKSVENIYKDEQNCTYIVHEDSSSTSRSQSDNSSDEKNKLHLRLQLDNSDTDTSSDSARDKSSSEYIPNEHILIATENNGNNSISQNEISKKKQAEISNNLQESNVSHSYLNNLKYTKNLSSDSTSYVEMKPLNPSDAKLLNTTGATFKGVNEESRKCPITVHKTLNLLDDFQELSNISKADSTSATLSNVSSISLKNESKINSNVMDKGVKSSPEPSRKSDVETAEYSFDFTSSLISSKKDKVDLQIKSPEAAPEKFTINDTNKNVSIDSPLLTSLSSQSSVSISDVADLIENSEKNSPYYGQQINNDSNLSGSNGSRKSRKNSYKHLNIDINKLRSEDLGDFSESSVPSLSNLSLDIHSE